MKASPESKIYLSCGHIIRDMKEGLFLEVDEPDGKTYGYYCKVCAAGMAGYSREPEREIKKEV